MIQIIHILSPPTGLCHFSQLWHSLRPRAHAGFVQKSDCGILDFSRIKLLIFPDLPLRYFVHRCPDRQLSDHSSHLMDNNFIIRRCTAMSIVVICSFISFMYFPVFCRSNIKRIFTHTYIMTQMPRGQEDCCTSHTLNNYCMISVVKR